MVDEFLFDKAGEGREACFSEFLDGLGDYFDGQSMTFPHVSNVVTALS